MKLDNRQLIEIVGVTAVVLSVLFLAFELRQSNRIAIANSEAESRTALRERMLTMLENPEIWELSVKIQNAESLSESEQMGMRLLTATYFSTWSSVVEQYSSGVMTDYTLGNYIETVHVFFKSWPGTWQYLAELRDDFNVVEGINPLWDAFLDELAARDL